MLWRNRLLAPLVQRERRIEMKPKNWNSYTNEQKEEQVLALLSDLSGVFLIYRAAEIAGESEIVSDLTKELKKDPKNRGTYLAWAAIVRDVLRIAIGSLAIEESLDMSDIQDMEMIAEVLSIHLDRIKWPDPRKSQ